MKEKLIIVTFPDIQYLMDRDDFEENCFIIDSESGINKYGNSAYLVNENWYNKIKNE